MEEFKERFIDKIIEWGVMKFAPNSKSYFTLKSGRKSPYFANMANAMSSGRRLFEMAQFYVDSIPEKPYFNTAHGPAMKGVPLAPIVAAEMYDRGKVIKYAFDFKDGLIKIRRDPPIGIKLRKEKDVQILDVVDAGLLRPLDCNGFSATALGEQLYDRVSTHYDLSKVDCIVGKAYAGIVPAALLLREMSKRNRELDLRFAYDRITTKAHGVSSESNFVGDLHNGDKVLVIDGRLENVGGVFGDIREGDVLRPFDDVITTGKAKRESKFKVEKVHPDVRWGGTHVGIYRGEKDEVGRTVIESLKEYDLDPLMWIVHARDIFKRAHNRQIAGQVHIDDTAMEAFEAYMKEFGAEA